MEALPGGAVSVRPADLSAEVGGAREGDEDAFRALYTDIQPRLLRYLWALVGADAEDVASETWLHVARDLRSFHGDSDGFRGWVATIARHRATDHMRALKRRPRPAAVQAEDLDSWAARDNTEDHALEAVSTDTALALIARLPRDQAEAVLLHVVVGLDAVQAARLLGKRPGAVRTASHRGLRRLSAMVSSATALGVVPQPLIRVLSAAAAPSHASELAREEQAVAAFQAHLTPLRSPPGLAPTSPLAKALTTKAAVVTLAALTAGGLAVTAVLSTPTRQGPAPGSTGSHLGRAASAHAGAPVPAPARHSHTAPAATPTVTAIARTTAPARLPATARARLPLSTLVHLPTSVLAKLPVWVLRKLPWPVLRRLPASLLATLPPSVHRPLPVPVLRPPQPLVPVHLPTHGPAVHSQLPAHPRSPGPRSHAGVPNSAGRAERVVRGVRGTVIHL